MCETPIVFGASWGPDGIIALGQKEGGLLQVSAQGGTPEELTGLEEGELAHRLAAQSLAPTIRGLAGEDR